jgi:hypothetical protein
MPRPKLMLTHRTEPALALHCPSCGEPLRTRHVSEAWIEVEAEPGWIASYRIAVKDGKPLIAEVRVFPGKVVNRTPGQWSNDAEAVPGGGLSSRVLRALHLGEPRSLFPKFMRNLQRRSGRESADWILAPFGIRRTDRRLGGHRPGRAGRPDEFYLIWAVAYLERVDEGNPQPVKDLANDPPESIARFISAANPSVETVRGFLNEARDRGLLTRPPSGKPGGRLTARALRIIEAGGLEGNS